jgi:hypothetical protein
VIYTRIYRNLKVSTTVSTSTDVVKSALKESVRYTVVLLVLVRREKPMDLERRT